MIRLFTREVDKRLPVAKLAAMPFRCLLNVALAQGRMNRFM